MIEWIITQYRDLPPEVQALLKWLFHTQLSSLIGLLALLTTWQLRRKIIDKLNRFWASRSLPKKLRDYSPQEIKRGVQYYIWPACQSVDPAQNDEARQTVAVRNDLCTTMDDLLKQDTVHKHFILLADSGMGKTSFLLNYFARHLRRFRKSYAMVMIPLGVSGLAERLKEISEPGNTILLLDAFDEDTAAIQDHTQRLSDIMDWTRNFYRVVITCRTQFFPRDEEIPKETGIIKVGPREAGEGPHFTFYKLYLSPFSDEQVQAYLKRRFPVWRKSCRRQARAIVEKIPNLAVRPMLLAYVDDLIDSGRSFENSFQIYEIMVDAWLERERRQVADKDALHDFSTKLAVELLMNREQRGSERVPYSEIEPLAIQFGIQLKAWQLAGRSLLNRDAEGNYKFAHRSILEFLFAQRILVRDEKARQLFPTQWTDQIKQFLYEGRNGRPLTSIIPFVRFEGGEYQVKKTNHTVVLKPFELAVFPVTNQEYEEYDPSHRTKRDEYSDRDNQPVVRVSWDDAVNYCQWLSQQAGENYRLPTDAEWEFAAGGRGQREYPWGNAAPTPERANYGESNLGKTTPVGAYPLGMTPEGLFDLAGNVWEWCADLYNEEQDRRVVRGGAFYGLQDDLRCALRLNPSLWNNVFSFRVARGAQS